MRFPRALLRSSFVNQFSILTRAVCLDGTVPGYHHHPGFGSGADNWLVDLETSTTGTEFMFAIAMVRHSLVRVTMGVDITGGHAVRSFYDGVVTLQSDVFLFCLCKTPVVVKGVAQNLPKFCTSRMDATLCFFPQYMVANITTPTFLLNAAYDTWQIQQALAPIRVDPKETWKACKFNHSACDSNQMQILQGFRNTMLNALQGFAAFDKNGHFINSCFTHGQIYDPNKWYSDNSPTIGDKRIATSVGDWYFDRSQVKAIDCAYPCDNTCHHDL
ncbi:protein notum [Musa troglodytarum]|uniref:Pectin acetylesterase n=1 Tax=Musa troglodytarum TaxID=320322 RepID=A0A9E7G4S8_9LILI|nr:protein notum [Musa troglodytarum]